jgi:hypothetical protein
MDSYVFDVFVRTADSLLRETSHVAEKIRECRNVDEVQGIDVKVDPDGFSSPWSVVIIQALSEWQARLYKAVFAFGFVARLFANMEQLRNRSSCKNIDLDNFFFGELVVPFRPDDSRFHCQVPDAKSKLNWELAEAMESLGCHFLRVVGIAEAIAGNFGLCTQRAEPECSSRK